MCRPASVLVLHSDSQITPQLQAGALSKASPLKLLNIAQRELFVKIIKETGLLSEMSKKKMRNLSGAGEVS